MLFKPLNYRIHYTTFLGTSSEGNQYVVSFRDFRSKIEMDVWALQNSHHIVTCQKFRKIR